MGQGSAMKKILIMLIRWYQYLISPYIPSSCRYHPSCSSYAIEAIDRHGVITGTILALRRLGRCHPFHEGGYDPVP